MVFGQAKTNKEWSQLDNKMNARIERRLILFKTRLAGTRQTAKERYLSLALKTDDEIDELIANDAMRDPITDKSDPTDDDF